MTRYPQISWYIEGQIILVTYPEGYTEQDLEATVSAKPVIQMLDAGTGPLVHIIQDFSALGDFRITNLGKLIQVNRTPGRIELYRHKKLGWFVDIAHPRNPIRYLDSVITQMFNARHRAFSTLDDAVGFLKRVDVTIVEPS